MKFKTKDLLVTVLPKVDKELAKLCLLHTKICKCPTLECAAQTLVTCANPTFCPNPTLHCGPCSIVVSKTCLNCSALATCGVCSAVAITHCNPTVTCIGCSAAITQCNPTVVCDIRCSIANTGNCGFVSGGCAGGCTIAISGGGGCQMFNSCGPDGSVCDPTIFCLGGSQDPFVIRDREDLAILRAEMQEALRGLDAMEKDLQSSIATKEDADAIEKTLGDALKHVQNVRKGLK